MREFGIYPDDCMPRQWWGARAIVENRNGKWSFALLPDRQNYEKGSDVSDSDKSDMFYWMETVMDAALKEKVQEYKFRVSDELFVLDSASGQFHCEASCRNSGGYMYIGCWEL